jgi:hypothetical protein
MYEVVLPILSEKRTWGRGGGSDLLETQQGRDSEGCWFIVFHPRDHLIEWLDKFTPSWAYYHDFVSPQSTGYFHLLEPTGVLFGFRESSDAVLFKLTWCNV